MDEESVPNTPSVIVAKGSNDYRWRRYLLVLFIFGYGLYSLYDGFDRYPRDNNAAKAQGLEALPHPGFDIQFNRAFGVALPLLALFALGWALYVSRGQYQFDGDTLTVPGHPPVPLSAIHTIDRSKWDRKGIAFLHYDLPEKNKKGIIKLDDFIYQRTPTDEIFKLIESAIESTNAVTQPEN